MIPSKTEVIFETEDKINVFADDFYTSQIITNYLTNAIKHVENIDGEKYIKITNKEYPERNCTGENNERDCSK